MDDIVFIGDWIKDRVLGSGSFGTVVLWKHKNTDEKLAIKTCKWGDELTAKHRERWTKEVEMLQNCNNPNIVGTKKLPPEFMSGLERANPSKLPILCMEYCSGGDLRQVLNRPDSCGGLKESQVRKILSDIRNAMQFLHANKITHRDLKPENIVMHHTSGSAQNENVTYKLIDLGYAKEIDSHSTCASFVGTLQYLAPELFYSPTYSNSVDFWSFGLLAFEVICGLRPFLPFMAPMEWIPRVKEKAHDIICIYETFHGDIEYSNEVFPENHISLPFKKLIEEWLRVALEFDPKKRGRDAPSKVTFNIPSEEKGSPSKIIFFNLLENILMRKIIKIFSVSSLSYFAYEIDDTTTIMTLKSWLKADSKIPTEDQIIISPTNFVDISSDDLVSKYWNDNISVMLFMYNKKQLIDADVPPVVPKAVQRCLEHHKALYNFKNSQNLYRNAFYFILSQMELYDSLMNGLVIRAESIKSEGKQLLLKHNVVDKSLGKLIAKEETVRKMTELGKKHVEHLRENGIGTNLLGGFDKIFKNTSDLSEKTEILQNAWSQLSVRIQSATRRSIESVSPDLNNFVSKYNFQSIYTTAYKTFISHKKNDFYSGNKAKEKPCADVVKMCYDCLKLRNKILHELQHQQFLLKMKDLSIEFSKIADIIMNAADKTSKFNTELSDLTDEITNCMWSTISLVIRDADNLSELPYSVVSFQKKDFKIGEPVSNHYAQSPVKGEDNEVKSLITESLNLRKNHMSLCDKLNSQKNLLQKSVYDFGFLDD